MSKKLFPFISLSTNSASVFLFTGATVLARPLVRNIFKPKIINWRLPDQTSPVADPLLNTDGEELLNTDGETLFNTGA